VTRAALDTLVQIMQYPKAPYGARMLAANAILDRGYGRPPQDTTITMQRKSIDELSDAELMAIAGGRGRGRARQRGDALNFEAMDETTAPVAGAALIVQWTRIC